MQADNSDKNNENKFLALMKITMSIIVAALNINVHNRPNAQGRKFDIDPRRKVKQVPTIIHDGDNISGMKHARTGGCDGLNVVRLPKKHNKATTKKYSEIWNKKQTALETPKIFQNQQQHKSQLNNT